MSATLEDFLDVRAEGDAVRMAFPRTVHGAFGGAFGGLIASGAVLAGRALAQGRVPSGIDCRFVRGLRAGDARLSSTVLHRGRSLTLVRVDVHDSEDRLATTATVSCVDPAVLHPLDVPPASPWEQGTWREWVLPPDVDIPIVDLLRPRMASAGTYAIATSMVLGPPPP